MNVIPYDDTQWRATFEDSRKLLLEMLMELARLGQAHKVQTAIAAVNAYLRAWDARQFDDFGAWLTSMWNAQDMIAEAINGYLALARARKAVQP